MLSAEKCGRSTLLDREGSPSPRIVHLRLLRMTGRAKTSLIGNARQPRRNTAERIKYRSRCLHCALILRRHCAFVIRWDPSSKAGGPTGMRIPSPLKANDNPETLPRRDYFPPSNLRARATGFKEKRGVATQRGDRERRQYMGQQGKKTQGAVLGLVAPTCTTHDPTPTNPS